MVGLAGLLLLGLVCAIGLSTVTMVHKLRHPPRKTYAWAVAKNRPGTPAELDTPRAFEEIALDLLGRKLPAWVIDGDVAEGPLVIFTPGWGDSRVGVLPRLGPLLRHASRVVAWDPPGLGEAEGICLLGVHEPVLLAEIVRQFGDHRGVVLSGSSLGAGVSIVAAARLGESEGTPHILGVIAEAPYRLPWTPAFNVMRLSALPWRVPGPLAFFFMGLRDGNPLWRGFDRAAAAARLTVPLLVLHGEDDEVSPLADGRAIAEAADSNDRGELRTIPRGQHNNLWTEPALSELADLAVHRFLIRVIPQGISAGDIEPAVEEQGNAPADRQ